MSRQLNVNSSDLETARNAASRAAGVAEGPDPRIASYVRFTPVAEEELPGNLSWQASLERCLKLTSGSGIVIMDENALIIAAEGAWGSVSAEQFEMLGPRLNAALDQAAHIEGDEGPCRALAIQAGTFWLTGIRLAGDRPTDQITIGVVAPAALTRELQRNVEGLVRRALGA